MVSALFVETDGAYFGRPDVDPWDITRDAREYAGPNPVVAHPPCNKWSPLAHINQKRLPGYRIGDDGGCFTSALASVREFGGVLEHPALTLAWPAHQLPRPQRGAWSFPIDKWAGRVTEVDQGRYGHRARKRTWLYVVSPSLYLPQLDWEPAESSVIVSGFLHRKGTDESRRVRPKEASATTPAFRELLLEIARNAHVLEVAA